MKNSINYYGCFILLMGFFSTCSNHIYNNRSDNKTSTGMPPEWRKGVALYSFHKFPFETALAKADSAGAKNVEGFSFYQLGKEFNNITMGNLSGEGLQKMKQMLDKRGLKMPSMYVEGAKDADVLKIFLLSTIFLH